MTEPITTPPPPEKKRSLRMLGFVFIVIAAAVLTSAITALLMSMLQRKIEAKNPWVRLVEVDETTTDPAQWGKNWPREYDGYLRTVDVTRTRFGGSEALPEEKIDRDPWLRRMFLGYAFSLDYRDRRGHAYMLTDQLQTERVTQRPQPGACLHCHASIIPTYRRIGAEKLGKPQPTPVGFDWPSVMEGFKAMSGLSYTQAHAELLKTPDGTPSAVPIVDRAPATGSAAPTTREALAQHVGEAHPVSCIDCHDPQSMELRVTRPGFLVGIRALAESEAPVPHLPSIERWRQTSRSQPYDPNVDATRQEMRSFVCGQCHVEYYCGPKVTLFFPWGKGLRVEQIEAYYDSYKFPDGHRFYDWQHGATGAELLKAQHPEFEMWSQGVHARSGVACADCHMPYVRQGATKVSDHWIRSPLLKDNINRACQTCHRFPEDELAARADLIQTRTYNLQQRAAASLMDMMDSINAARLKGAPQDQLQPILELHRKAQWRLDFVAAENSMGFHASQEAARILAESIDFSRQAQVAATALVGGPVQHPTTNPSATPVIGVTPSTAPARQ
jgi:nitrite reductase (cytochrome c-552)